ncbi:MAG: phosphotransferase family protein [Armatimonadetes bacterium]|nr:phosphotransferase family protein [Armatimonadota bacterium]
MLNAAQALASTIPALRAARAVAVQPLHDVVMLNNHNFRVDADGRTYLLRLASDHGRHLGIRRAEEEAAAHAAAAAGVSPEVIWSDARGNHLLAWIDGRHWRAEDFADEANRARLADVLRRLRGIGAVAANGRVTDRIDALLASARALGLAVTPDLLAHRDRAVAFEDERRASAGFAPCLCHNDLWTNNFMDDGERLWLVDWEFGGLGDGLYDVATLSWSAGWDDAVKRAFLVECGYREDELASAARITSVVTLFEGCWALVMHGLRGSAGFDYLAAAQSCFGRLDKE